MNNMNSSDDIEIKVSEEAIKDMTNILILQYGKAMQRNQEYLSLIANSETMDKIDPVKLKDIFYYISKAGEVAKDLCVELGLISEQEILKNDIVDMFKDILNSLDLDNTDMNLEDT